MPSTHDEVVELAYYGYKEGGGEGVGVVVSEETESDKRPAGGGAERCRDDLGGASGLAGETEKIENSANGAQTLAQENSKAVEGLKESVGTRASAERVSGLQEELSATQGRLSSMEAKQQGIAYQQAEARRDMTGDNGWWSRRSMSRYSRWWRTPRCWWVRWRSRRI